MNPKFSIGDDLWFVPPWAPKEAHRVVVLGRVKHHNTGSWYYCVKRPDNRFYTNFDAKEENLFKEDECTVRLLAL